MVPLSRGTFEQISWFVFGHFGLRNTKHENFVSRCEAGPLKTFGKTELLQEHEISGHETAENGTRNTKLSCSTISALRGGQIANLRT